jgi:hypothetical protein
VIDAPVRADEISRTTGSIAICVPEGAGVSEGAVGIIRVVDLTAYGWQILPGLSINQGLYNVTRGRLRFHVVSCEERLSN